MQFSNSFEVSLPPAQAWKTLMNIPGIAPCMPGAELTEVVDADTYKGKVAVRMGPVVLAFAGTAKFEERDDQTRRARVKAQGSDSKGRGGASALVNFHLEPSGSGSKVLIDTDLNLSGSVAQYGRGAGMIQTIAAQLINQFAKSLEKQIAQAAPVAAAATPSAAAEPGGPTAKPEPQWSAERAAKPIGGFTLMMSAIWAALSGLFRDKNESTK
jgi:carbon monoxide dehydrogenase subunit G